MQGCVGSSLKPINTSLSYCWKSIWKSTMNATPCPRPTTNPQGSSDTPTRRLQYGFRTPSRRHKTPPSRLQDALKSFAKQHVASNRLQATPMTPQNAAQTQKYASKPPPRSLQDGLGRRQDDFKSAWVMKICYAEVLLCKLLPKNHNSEITHIRGSAALA